MLNKDKPWFDDQCRRAFGFKQEAHLRWIRDLSLVNWDVLVRCQVEANETYSKAERQFSGRNRDVLMKAQLCSSLPPLIGLGLKVDCCASRLVRPICCQIRLFDGKQSGSLLICLSLQGCHTSLKCP